MKTKIASLMMFTLALGLKSQAQCTNPINLVVNSNFSAGNTGFTSQIPAGAGCGSNSYTVATNFNTKCLGWPNIADHTPAGPVPANYLIVDGSTSANLKDVWRETVNVCAGKSYTFKFWVYSIYAEAFDLGMAIGTSTTNVAVGLGGWNAVSTTWIAPTTGPVSIGIVQNTAGAYRDFGIDDVSFEYCCETYPLTLTGATTIWAGSSTTLSASGAPGYIWSNGATTSSITVSPTVTTSYTVTGTDGCSCTTSSVVTVTVIQMLPGCANPVNLVVNSNFSAGNTGFTSQIPASAGCGSNSYTVASNFNTKCLGWPNVADHTPAGPVPANYLIVDGSTSANLKDVWRETVNVCAGKSYTFKFWVYSIYAEAFDLGMAIGTSTTNVAVGLGGWNAVSTTWIAPTSGPVSIGIVQNTAGAYRDFGIDDVYFGYCCEGNSLTVTGTTTICAGSSTNLFASGASGYIWSTGETTSSIKVNPTSTTSYTVTGTDGCACNTSTIVTVTVKPLPKTLISKPISICSGSNGVLSAGGATSYTWSTGSNSSAISVNPPVTTTYTLLSAGSNGCVRTTTISLTVIATPTVIMGGACGTTVCLGTPVVLTASGASTYQWSANAGSAITNTVSVTPTVTTTYTITGQNGSLISPCSNSTTCTVYVSAPVNVVVNGDFSSATTNTVNSTLSLETTECIPGTYLITSNFNIKCHLWPSVFDHTFGTASGRFLNIDNDMNSGIQTAWTQTVSTVVGKTYTFSFWANGIYSEVTNPFTMQTIINNISTFTTVPIIAGSWNQYTAPSYVATTSTTRLSLLIGSTSPDTDFKRDFGIDDISFTSCYGNNASRLKDHTTLNVFETQEINIYPNPSSGVFTLNTNNEELKDIYIYDITGNLIFEKTATKEQFTQIDITEHKKGMYFVKLMCNGKIQTKRIINE